MRFEDGQSPVVLPAPDPLHRSARTVVEFAHARNPALARWQTESHRPRASSEWRHSRSLRRLAGGGNNRYRRAWRKPNLALFSQFPGCLQTRRRTLPIRSRAEVSSGPAAVAAVSAGEIAELRRTSRPFQNRSNAGPDADTV